MNKFALIPFVFIFFSLIPINVYAVDTISNCAQLLTADNRTYINTSTNFLDFGTCNISEAPGGTLIINASNLTVDCNDTILSGNYTGSAGDGGYAINVSNFNNVTIKNCNIHRYSHGIYYNNSLNSNISNNTIELTVQGILLNYTNNTSVSSNIVRGLGTDLGGPGWGDGVGIVIGGISGDISTNASSFNNTISDNRITNEEHGVFMRESDNNSFSYNEFNLNMFGVAIWGSNNTRFINNTIISNELCGLALTCSVDVIIWNDDIINNSQNIMDVVAWCHVASTYTIVNATVGEVDITVQTGGNITISNLTSSPTDPTNLYNISKYLNLTNESTVDTWMYLNISYEDSEIAGFNESTLRIYHYNNTTSAWENITGAGVNKDNNYAHANITNFSIVGVFGDKPPVRSAGSPTGTVTSSSTTLSLTTNENCNCKYSTIANTGYYSMGSVATSSGTSHSWSLSGLSNDAYTYYVRCKDLANNINTDDYSISFTISAGSTSGGGGGGGGITTIGETETIAAISAGGTANAIFSEEAVSSIELTVKEAASNVKLTIQSSGLPSSTAAPEGTVYKYLKLSKANVEDTNIEGVIIKFKVGKSWITENNIDAEKVYLLRLVNNAWERLDTIKVSETSVEVNYEAESSGFSYFVIAGEKLEGMGEKVVGEENVTEAGKGIEETSEVEFTWASVLIVIMLVIIGLVWHLYSKKKK